MRIIPFLLGLGLLSAPASFVSAQTDTTEPKPPAEAEKSIKPDAEPIQPKNPGNDLDAFFEKGEEELKESGGPTCRKPPEPIA